MPDPSTAVTLTVDGLDYGGWTSVEISAGLERQARDFTIGITWRWPGQNEARPIKQGARCQLRIGGDLVLTGYVFATPVNYDDKRVTVSIKGRSITADLVDCAAVNKPGQWKNQSVQAIVAALAKPYSIKVVSQIATTASLTDHTIEPGEKAFESIDRLLTLFRVFSTDNARGEVVLAEPGSAGRAVDQIELGRNVKTCDASLDFSGVFSDYQVIGQRSGTDDSFGVEASEVSASVSDERISRYRALVIQESGQMTAKLAADRANWERGNRIGRALEVTYVVTGWRQSNGALWLPNMIARVVDPMLGMDRDMLIVEVTYTLNDQGTTCTLKVGPPDSYLPEPNDPHKKRKLKKSGKDDFEYLLPADWKPDA